jgi:hypothetical protein
MSNFDLKKYLAEGKLLKEDNIELSPTEKINQYIKNGNKGNLYLNYTEITSLPDNFKVEGDLRLYGTLITSLPNNLKVGGQIDLRNTPITSLPNDLQVKGDLLLDDTPLSKKYSGEEIEKMVPGVKGDIRV